MKRIWSIVLVLTALLAVLCVGVAAETDAAEETPQLWYASVDSPTALNPLDGVTIKQDEPFQFYLYYGTSSECVELKGTQVGSSNRDCFFVGINNYQEENQNYCLIVNGLGSAQLTYTEGESTYTANITVTLPREGFYSSPNRNADSFIETLSYSYAATTIWLLREESYPADLTLTATINDEAVESISVTQESGGIKIVLPAELTLSGENDELKIVGKQSEDTVIDRTIMIELPGLMYTSVSSRHGVYTEDTKAPTTLDGYALWGLSEQRICLYYGTSDSAEKQSGTLISQNPNILDIQTAQLANGEICYLLTPKAFGTTNLAYTVGDITVYADVKVELPWIGIYTTNSATPQTYCHEISYNPVTGTTVWILQNGGFSDTVSLPTYIQINGQKYDVTPKKIKLSAEEETPTKYGVELFVPAGLDVPTDRSVFMQIPELSWVSTNIKAQDVPRMMYHTMTGNGTVEIDTPVYSYNCKPTDETMIRLYYGKSDNKVQLTSEDVAFPTELVDVTWYQDRVVLKAKKCGSGYIEYQVGDTTHKLLVTISLPAVWSYFSTTASEETIVTSSYPALYNEFATKEENTFYIVPLDGYRLLNVSPTQNEIGAEISLSVDGSYAAIVANHFGNFTIQVDYQKTNGNGMVLTEYVYGFASSQRGESFYLPLLEINDVEYTFCLGTIQASNTEVIPMRNFPLRPVSVCAVTDLFQTTMAEAGPEIYDMISNVKFEVVSCKNHDGTEAPYLSLTEPEKVNTDRINAVEVYPRTAPGKYFTAEVKVTFDVKVPNDKTYTLDITYTTSYEDPTGLNVIANDLTTVEKFNEVFANRMAMEDWIEAKTGVRPTNTRYIDIVLPEVTYNGVLKMGNISSLNSMVTFHGAENGGTVIKGSLEAARVIIRDITFVADDHHKLTIGEKTISCGAYGGGTLTNCYFTGYDVAIYFDGDHVAQNVHNCEFIDCKVGYYIDSSAELGYSPYSVGNNLFFNCEKAIHVASLPDLAMPFLSSIINNDFINNNVDIEINHPGTFYCRGNFFGTYNEKWWDKDNRHPGWMKHMDEKQQKWDDEKWEKWFEKHMKKLKLGKHDDEDLYYRPAITVETNGAVIVTGPRSAQPLNITLTRQTAKLIPGFWENNQMRGTEVEKYLISNDDILDMASDFTINVTNESDEFEYGFTFADKEEE